MLVLDYQQKLCRVALLACSFLSRGGSKHVVQCQVLPELLQPSLWLAVIGQTSDAILLTCEEALVPTK